MTMQVFIASFIYAVAMTAANLSIAACGPWVSPINSFFLIGLDLTLRDWLHVRVPEYQMLGLICVSGAVTYLLNPSSSAIAVASAVAFTSAAFVDWAAFTHMKGSWFSRANKSNVAGAAVDSVVFPTLAFGVLMPHIIALQFAAKVVGGFVWSLLFNYFGRKTENPLGV